MPFFVEQKEGGNDASDGSSGSSPRSSDAQNIVLPHADGAIIINVINNCPYTADGTKKPGWISTFPEVFAQFPANVVYSVSYVGDESKRAIYGTPMFQEDRLFFGVYVDKSTYKGFYEGVANGSSWPLFHNMMDKRTGFTEENWRQAVNATAQTLGQYQQVIVSLVEQIRQNPESQNKKIIILVHDYQLMLLIGMLKEQLVRYNDIEFRYFHHIPIMDVGILDAMQRVSGLLEYYTQVFVSLTSADLVGFHCQKWLDNFKACCEHLHIQGRARLEVNPIGIASTSFHQQVDFQAVQRLLLNIDLENLIKRGKKTENLNTLNELLTLKISQPDRAFYFSGGRLDYTKAFPEFVDAYSKMLEEHPEVKGNSSLILLCPDSRDGVEAYRREKEKLINAIQELKKSGGSVFFFNENLDGNATTFLAQLSDVLCFASHMDGFLCMGLEGVMSQVPGYEINFLGHNISLRCGAQLIQSETIGAYEHVQRHCLCVEDPKKCEEYAAILYQGYRNVIENFELVRRDTLAIQDTIFNRLNTQTWGLNLARENSDVDVKLVRLELSESPRSINPFEDFCREVGFSPEGWMRGVHNLATTRQSPAGSSDFEEIGSLTATLSKHPSGGQIAAQFNGLLGKVITYQRRHQAGSASERQSPHREGDLGSDAVSSSLPMTPGGKHVGGILRSGSIQEFFSIMPVPLASADPLSAAATTGFPLPTRLAGTGNASQPSSGASPR